MKKNFCLPFNGDVSFTLRYASAHRDQIYEYYGSDGYFITGRNGGKVTKNDFIDMILNLQELGIGFNYLLNALNIEEYIRNEDEIMGHLRELKQLGLEYITIAHPSFVKKLHDIGFKTATSLVQNLYALQEIEWAEAIGYDRIICSDDLNREYWTLKQIILEQEKPIEIILNNICIPFCPFRHSHYGFDGRLNTDVRYKFKKKDIVLCRSIWEQDPVSFLKSGWIRPEEVEKYYEIGVSYFKIAGRNYTSENLEKLQDIYLSGHYDGYVFDYLKPGIDPQQKYNLKNIKNKDLDDYFFHFFNSPETGCKHQCKKCNYCEKVMERLL